MNKYIIDSLQDDISSLRSKGVNNQDILDLLFTLIFWKFISDELKKANKSLDAVFLFGRMNKFSGLQIKEYINKAFADWNATNRKELPNIILVDEHLLWQAGDDILLSLCSKIGNLFSVNWSDEKQGISRLFSAIELLFANSMGSPHLFLTPLGIVTLISQLIISKGNQAVYDPFCRSGDLLAETVCNHKEIEHVAGNAYGMFGYKIALLKSIMLQFPAPDIKNQSIYDRDRNEKFDCIVANPPFGGKLQKDVYQNAGEWLKAFGGVRQEVDFFSHILDNLNEKGQATVIVPAGLLFSSGKVQQFRQKLVEENLLEAVVHLPTKVFYQTGVTTAIFLVNFNKTHQEVLLVNAATLGVRQRDRHIFSDNDIFNIVNLIESFRNGNMKDRETEIFIRVTSENLRKYGFDLQFATYQTNEPEGNSPLPASGDIWNEMVSLNEELDAIQKEIAGLQND